MMSKKLLSTLPFLAAQATAIDLATSQAKIYTKADMTAAIYDVLKVFYPNCWGLTGDLTDIEAINLSCTKTEEQAQRDTFELLREVLSLGYPLETSAEAPSTP